MSHLHESRADVMRTHLTVSLSFWDRIRVLFGAKIRLCTETRFHAPLPSFDPSETETTVDRVFPRWPRRGDGCAMLESGTAAGGAGQ